ncbi:MAG TPA: helix-turn-helix transcriptional regulator, partial [Paracoccus sp.]|nr:helix-turn-helix transcriptional regulator [Paracoccus sp. (in: a-proteobacteria)]
MHTAPPLFDTDTARGRLLAIAARLFRERGYAGTTVRDIASAMGILSGSLFH